MENEFKSPGVTVRHSDIDYKERPKNCIVVEECWEYNDEGYDKQDSYNIQGNQLYYLEDAQSHCDEQNRKYPLTTEEWDEETDEYVTKTINRFKVIQLKL